MNDVYRQQNEQMSALLMNLARCPVCRGALHALEDPPRLGCGCGACYPIVRGIPRFAGDSYVESFGRQWNRYDVARDEEDDATFRVKTGVSASDLAGQLVLDAGCGGGRYTLLVAKHGATV